MTGPWVSGESLSPSRLNLHAGAATLATGFSTDTLQGQSGVTVNVLSDLSAQRTLAAQREELGGAPSSTSAMLSLRAHSQQSDYLFFQDAAGLKSNFLLGLRTGDSNASLVDGLNLYDASDNTMIVRFSSDSVRFYPPIVAPVFDTGGALASTYNAALFLRGSSKESQIQAAITAADADGIARVYVPANLYPYSAASISFSTNVQMVREGGDWTVFDIIAYGANGNASSSSATANQAAIQAAIDAANWDPAGHGIRGGTVFIPTGQYNFSGQLTVPIAVNQGQVTLRGEHMRSSILVPVTSGGTSILFGSPVPDLTGSSTSITQFGALENLEIVGTQVGANTCAVQWTEMQKGWMQNVIITGFAATGCTGLYLRGSTGNSAPHSWRGGFYNVVVASTYNPLIIQNGDENDFFNCNFGLPVGLNSAATAIQILQGNANRFFGLTVSGEVSSLTTGRPNYTGIKLSATTGNTSNNQFFGTWVEGHDSGVSIASGVSNNAFVFINPAICRVSITDNGQSTYYTETANLAVPLYQYPDGTAAGPSYAFHSEGSLGWYRSATSIMALSPTGRLGIGSGAAFNSATTPEFCFTADTDTGFFRSGANQFDFTVGATRAGRILLSGGVGQWNIESGSNATPSIAFVGEPKLGWYTSATSTMALSYGTLNLGAQANIIQLPLTGSAANPTVKWGTGAHGMNFSSAGFWDSIGSGTVSVRFGPGQALVNDAGSASSPGYAFLSEASLGFYRSAASVLALSYGGLGIKAGTNASCGTAVLSTGSVHVSTTFVKTGDLIFLTDQTPGGTLGALEINGITNASGFTIQSSSVADTGTIAWLIVRPT